MPKSIKTLLRSLIRKKRINRIYITINYFNNGPINHITGNSNNISERDIEISGGEK